MGHVCENDGEAVGFVKSTRMGPLFIYKFLVVCGRNALHLPTLWFICAASQHN